jgi:hypothetical protein
MAPSRRNILAAAVTATVVLGLALGVWPAISAPEDEIKAVHSGKVIGLVASPSLGSPVVQRSSGGADREWNVVELTTINGWPLVLIQSAQSGLVLDVAGGFTGAGAPLVQTPWAGSASQLWLLLPYGDTGLELILNIKSGRVADVAGASSDDGASIIQWDWLGGANQIWDVPETEPLPTTTTTSMSSTTTSSPASTSTTTTGPTTTTTEPDTTTTTQPPTTTTSPPGLLETITTLLGPLTTTTTAPPATTTTTATPPAG